ncbi:MAG: alpha-glucosidase [Rhodobacteraceae bacterium]|nr:alpha-glucosidase [Paracoccaceae bacterium]
MKTLGNWCLLSRDDCSVTLQVEGQHILSIEALENAQFRVRLRKDGQWRLARSWTVAPDGPLPREGRARDAREGFSCPPVEVTQEDGTITIATDHVRAVIRTPLHICWQAMIGGQWRDVAQDRPTGAYMLGRRDHRNAHFMARDRREHVFGLGEKTGPLDRTGRRYEMRNLDAMGYNAEATDPLYKHIPFTLTRTPDAGSFSLFYDTLAGCWLDLGNELDNYHAPYRSFRAEDGDLDYYFTWAPDMLALVKAQQHLTGGMAFPPRWSLGYSGSTMAYTDAPDAQAQMLGFLDALRTHEIPCDSFHLSSGYTSIDGKRYVFNWNTDKFPDIAGFARAYADAGIHIVANIKPCLLQDHPRYDEAAGQGLFIRDSDTDAPEISMFWDAKGSHLDFTNPDTLDWWQGNVTTALLDYGLDCTWNDNNEFEVWDDRAQCHGFGAPIDMGLIRPLHALLMTQASEAAQKAHAPDKRPYLITRAGCAGLQRHAQTWTGDNRTNWHSLRWNIRMGLGLAMSGISNIGHDVGGFAGPQPDGELLLRWVQNGIFHPRFVIHSWNDDGSVTEPWTHPDVLPLIRDAFALRYRFLPYLYTCLWQAVTKGEPMLRPTFLDHEDDAECLADTDDFMLGRDLLVASVVEQGAQQRCVYLPRNATGWWDFHAGTWHAGGQWLKLAVSLDSIPLFVRAGAVLTMAQPGARSGDAASVAAVFPAPDHGVHVSQSYDDGGDNADALSGNHCVTRFELSRDGAGFGLSVTLTGQSAFAPEKLRLVLPEAAREPVRIGGAAVAHGEFFSIRN